MNKIPFRERITATVNETREATGLGRTKIYELIGEGKITSTTVDRRRLINVRSLLHLLEQAGSKAS